MTKTLNLLLLLTALIILPLVGCVAQHTQEEDYFITLTNNFFDAVKEKDAAKARTFLVGEGKSDAYKALFSSLLPQGIDFKFTPNAASALETTSPTEKRLLGTINPSTANNLIGGQTIPVTVTFYNENGTWKIKQILEDRTKQKNSTAGLSNAEIIALVRQTMADFIVSKKTKSMAHFYTTIADAWKRNTSPQSLDKSYKQILLDPTDWSFLNPVEPTITKTSMDKNDVLTILGIYPTKPKRLIFQASYIKENGAWKVVGFKLYTAEAEAPK